MLLHALSGVGRTRHLPAILQASRARNAANGVHFLTQAWCRARCPLPHGGETSAGHERDAEVSVSPPTRAPVPFGVLSHPGGLDGLSSMTSNGSWRSRAPPSTRRDARWSRS